MPLINLSVQWPKLDNSPIVIWVFSRYVFALLDSQKILAIWRFSVQNHLAITLQVGIAKSNGDERIHL